MPGATLRDLLVHAAKDMYFAENAIYKALPKMIEGAKNADLKEGLTEHRKETKDQIGRLEKIFGILDMKPQTVPCEAIKGILKEGEEALEEFGDGAAGDPAVIFSCQAVEHYEINRYGSMRTWATELGMDDVAELIEESLSEEYAADDKLTALAEGGVNEEAVEGAGKSPPRRAAAKSSSKSPTKKSSRA
jgi:ferritin-like metal-binding protein YciE